MAGKRARTVNTDSSGWKIMAVACLVGLAWLGLWARAGYVQLVLGDHLAEMARKQHLAAEFERGRRGEILDRNGRVLAQTVRFNSVYANPVEVEDQRAAIKLLSSSLKLSSQQVTAKLKTRRNFVWIARQVSDRAASEIGKAEVKGIHLTHEYGRLYPNNHLAGQLVGFVGLDNKGLEGVELAFEERLAGRKAQLVVQRDASGRRLYLDAKGHEMDIDGEDVRLTIDSQIQDITEAALSRAIAKYGAKSGSCIMVDVQNGEILALANYPLFNPNIFRSQKPTVWRNRAALDVFEPGSTMKPMLVAAALQEGNVTPESQFDCENGKWKVRNYTVRDTHKYDWLPVKKILRYSSNVGAAKIGTSLGAPAYHEYLSRLGFGRRTGVQVPGESRGILRPVGRWNDVDLAAASFGYGLGVTTLQLAQAYYTIANDGVFSPLKLVKTPRRTDVQTERIFSSKVAREVRQMMIDAVQLDGTGTQARINGMLVGGKTGTAQRLNDDGSYGGKYMSSFAALFPGDNPRYLIFSVIEEPEKHYYGGVVAAPLVREVAVKSLAYYCKLPESPMDVEIVTETAVPTDAIAGRTEQPRDMAERGTVPNVVGLPLRRAMEMMIGQGVVPVLKGSGVVVGKQSPAPGAAIGKSGSGSVTLWLKGRADT